MFSTLTPWIQFSIPLTAAEALVRAFITFRSDYRNVSLFLTPANIGNKLQSIQNSAAHPLTHSLVRTRSHDHMTPVLTEPPLAPCPTVRLTENCFADLKEQK